MRLREVFLIAQPPLLLQGGEYAHDRLFARSPRHGRECRLHMPAFQQNDVKAGADPTGLVPLRQRPALEPDPLRPWSKLLEELHQGLWLTRHLELTRHCANGIHQTDAGEF